MNIPDFLKNNTKVTSFDVLIKKLHQELNSQYLNEMFFKTEYSQENFLKIKNIAKKYNFKIIKATVFNHVMNITLKKIKKEVEK